jgi:hypothetical protein
MKNTKQVSNPYYEIGLLHNEGLDFVIQNLPPMEPVLIEKIIQLSSQNLQIINNTPAKLSQAIYFDFIASTINKLNQIPFEILLKEYKVSVESTCFINEILNVSPDFDYSTTFKVLVNIESNILTSDLTQKDKQLPLLGVAVAKSSVLYWIEQIQNPESPWINFVGDTAAFAWPWKADVKGAVLGLIEGVIGELSDGSNVSQVISGGYWGAIGGAAAASAAAALDKE